VLDHLAANLQHQQNESLHAIGSVNLSLSQRRVHESVAKSLNFCATVIVAAGAQRLSEKGSDPLAASRFHWVFGLAGEGQTPFRIGAQ